MDEQKDYSYLLDHFSNIPDLKTLNIVPEEDIIDHDNDSLCPCNPKMVFKCPQTGIEIWEHKELKKENN